MLIQKKLGEGDVAGTMTLGGSEALFEIVSESTDHFVVKNFRVIAPDSSGSLALHPRPVMAEDNTTQILYKTSLSMVYSPKKQIEQEYKQAVSGIVIPPKSGIIV